MTLFMTLKKHLKKVFDADASCSLVRKKCGATVAAIKQDFSRLGLGAASLLDSLRLALGTRLDCMIVQNC